MIGSFSARTGGGPTGWTVVMVVFAALLVAAVGSGYFFSSHSAAQEITTASTYQTVTTFQGNRTSFTLTKTTTLVMDQTNTTSETTPTQMSSTDILVTEYLQIPDGSCTSDDGQDAPCFGNLATAAVFSCGNSAATPAGCTQVVKNESTPLYLFTITIWYPLVNQSGQNSSANCDYVIPDDTNVYSATCVPIGPSEFVVSTQIIAPA
jgi:hypothetical protein